jgi:hypothetical protein
MIGKILLTLAVGSAAAGFSAVPLSASGRDEERLVIGVRLQFTGPTTAIGSFAACCAVNDKGSASADVTSFTPKGNRASFTATNSFVGSKGSFTIAIQGVTGPLESERHIARGHWTVVGGTGQYAHLRGQGRLTAVTDETNGELTAIDEGEAHGADD